MTEGQRRSTTGGDDAQTTAAVAMTQLQREIRQSGLGIVHASLLACQLDLGVGRSLANLGPISINDAGVAPGDANTDTLLLTYGSAQGAAEGIPITAQVGSSYDVKVLSGTHLDEYVIAVPFARTAPCSLRLAKVTAEPVAGTTQIPVNVVLPGMAGGGLFNLGRTPRIVAFAVRNGSLTLCDMLTQNCASPSAENWLEIADGIVSLRAQYVQSTGVFDQVTPTGCPAWYGVTGLRMAMVARNSQYNADEVTPTSPTWAGAAALPITLSGEWKHFRYRTLETTLPLRNIVNVNPYYAKLLLSPCPP